MTDDQDIDALAAEYVLGSLDPAERIAVNERRRYERDLSEAIAGWERRLAALNEGVPGIAPPPDLYGKLASRIGITREGHQGRTPARRRDDRRTVLVTSSLALAACLLLAWGAFLYMGTRDPDVLVGELHRTNKHGTADEAHLPAFAVVVDRSKGIVSIRPSSVRPASGKSYALWLLPQRGATPVFLGTLSPSMPTTLPWSVTWPLREYVNSGLMITLEPEGVSRGQLPIGDVVFSGTLRRTDG